MEVDFLSRKRLAIHLISPAAFALVDRHSRALLCFLNCLTLRFEISNFTMLSELTECSLRGKKQDFRKKYYQRSGCVSDRLCSARRRKRAALSVVAVWRFLRMTIRQGTLYSLAIPREPTNFALENLRPNLIRDGVRKA